MLKAYFDESGHPSDHRIMSVGGGLAALSSWEKLEDLLAKELWDAGAIKDRFPYFKMSQFENYIAPFDWSPEKHKTVLARILDIMNDHIDTYVGAVLLGNPKETNLATQYKNDENDMPYYWCFFNGMTAVDLLTGDRYMNETSQVIFADQEEFGHKAMNWYGISKRQLPALFPSISSAAFAPYLPTIQLHTADLVAYTLIRHFKNLVDHKEFPYYPLNRLLEKPCHFMGWGSTVNWELPPSATRS